ncbi:Allergen Asp f 7-like protein [Colletotrichum orbiculare MAFF 240422]|uniref:Allergen Asp f 7-like protein n=1 Tax=Colletotrichum orbiculare (strain 104-T / ATCC 96160 / CBS 514.97 / LARS 414 / MAFF 240422) TaxID=1213857 RepID=N4VTD3_COLOR|nr:Allergen Asp f 7-like protein [Colletotrichum orbiculare MAFF 240422]
MFTKTIVQLGAVAFAAFGMAQAAPLSRDEIHAMDAINHVRRANGQSALVWTDGLKEDAKAMSVQLATSNDPQKAQGKETNNIVDIVSVFRSDDPNGVQMTLPVSESVRDWFNPGEKVSIAPSTDNSVTEKILSAEAKHIGCASSGTKQAGAGPWLVYVVCRIHRGSDLVERSIEPRGDKFTGSITYFEPGLGACGQTNSAGDFIVALSAAKMGSISNGNPYCGRKISISYPGSPTVDATVVDKCPGCAENDIDVTTAVFTKLFGSLTAGRVSGVTWELH